MLRFAEYGVIPSILQIKYTLVYLRNRLLSPGDSTQELTTVHSGSSSIKIVAASEPGFNNIRQTHAEIVEDDFYSYGGFFYWGTGDAPELYITNARLVRQNTLDTKIGRSATITGAWEHVTGVGRRDDDSTNSFNDLVKWGGNWMDVSDHFIDDTYMIHLDNISLTVTSASQANSTENVVEIRVDGRDTYLGPNAAGLGTASGTITFDWRPRHDAAQAVAFAETASEDAYIVSLFGDVDDYINVYWDSPNTIRLAYSMAGTTASGTWDATGAIVAGTQYVVEVAYTGSGNMTLKVAGTTRITLSAIPAAFGQAPDFAYYGSDSSGSHQGDATFSNTPTAVELMSFAANGVDGAVELRWETTSELNNLGFHVFRATTSEGAYERVTPRAIPGLGSSPVGASYSYRDAGLTNGVTYYYKLEDIETTGKTDMHGPVSATPWPAASGSGGESGSSASSSSQSASPSLITYGDPSGNSLKILKRSSRQLVLELVMEGFFAKPQEDGSVRLEVPGFEALSEVGAPGIPAKRSWVEAIAGRKVKLVSVTARGVEAFTSLRPSAAEVPEIVATQEGTVRAARRRRRARTAFRGEGLYPSSPARIVSVGFQGEAKKALVELAPLRWDESRGQLLLARRLVVRLSFREREPKERILADGVRGRRYARKRSHDQRTVVARLGTTERGLHSVRYEDVMRGRRGERAKTVRLSRQGETVAFHLEPASANLSAVVLTKAEASAGPARVFGPGSVLYFVSEGAGANPFGKEAVYELEVGHSREAGEAGEAMVSVPAAPSGEPQPVYWHRAEWEEDRYYQAALLEAPDLWLWDLLFAPEVKSYLIEVSSLAPSSGASKLSVWLQGVSDFQANPDHHVRVYVNGSLVEELSWDGKKAKHLDIELTPGLLREGDNLLELENVGDTEASYSMVMLDRYAVEYPRVALAGDGRLRGRWSESGTAELSGLVAGTHVLDMSKAEPRWLLDTEVGADGMLRFRAESGRSYLAVSPEAIYHPVVTIPRASRLKNTRNRADYVLIGPDAFLQAAIPLLELRQGEGLKVKAVSIEEVYSEFGFGQPTPQAVKDFLSYAYHNWRQPSPRYVLLLGDATYDFKDRLQTGVTNQVPPRMVRTSYLWTASDPSYAAVNGDDLLPDLAIGRLPTATVKEVRAIVDKIIAYETGEAGLHRAAVVLVADNPDRAGNFEADADQLAATVLASKNPEKIYLSQLGTTHTRNAIVQSFDEGASLVSYIGHGGIRL